MSDFLEVLRSRWLTIVLALLLFTAASIPVVQRVSHLHYQAASKVLLVSESAARDPSVISDDLPSIATGTTVLERVRDARLHLPMTLDALHKALSAKIGMHSMLLQVTATDRDPDRAVAIANAIAQTTSNYYSEISVHRYDKITAALHTRMDAARQRLADIDAQTRALA